MFFSGKTTKWSKLKGGEEEDISIILPRSRPGLVDQFQEIVLKPRKSGLAAQNSEDADAQKTGFLEQLAANRYGITFCLPSEVPDDLKAIRVKASSEGLALSPSFINLRSLDYPLLRYISLRASGKSDTFMDEFIRYSKSDQGQASIAKGGYIVNVPTEEDDAEVADIHRQTRLDSSDIPDSYKDLIRKADRLHSSMNLRFVPGTTKFELDSYSTGNFEKLSTYLRANPDSWQKVILIGFADSRGDAKANRTYSAKRAVAMAEKLREKGIKSIETAGMGEEIPVADNDTESGRDANRRVEVWLQR